MRLPLIPFQSTGQMERVDFVGNLQAHCFSNDFLHSFYIILTWELFKVEAYAEQNVDKCDHLDKGQVDLIHGNENSTLSWLQV